MIMSFDDTPKSIDCTSSLALFIHWQVDVERPIQQFTEHLGELPDKASHESLGSQSISHGHWEL